jgi:phosphatidylinositol-3-phosphatase
VGRSAHPRQWLRVLLASCLLVTGCAPTATRATPPATAVPARSGNASTTGSPSPASQPVRVAVIVMENHGYASVIGLPYIRTLVSASTALTDYHAVSHPSLPNYLALTSGFTWGITDDGYHVLPEQDIGDQLTAAGVPWRAYMEGMGSDCRQGNGEYAVKHDPFAYYGGRCQPGVVPLSQLTADLAGASPPRFVWITPNLCNDMHDCSPAVGDSWLRQTVPALLGSPAMANGVLLITWDENEGSGPNQVLTLVLGSRRATAPGSSYSHPSLLASVEDLLGLPRLAATRAVPAIALD